MVYLIGLLEKVLVDGEHVSKLVEKDLPHGVVDDLNAQVTFYVAVDVVAAAAAAAGAFQVDG